MGDRQHPMRAIAAGTIKAGQKGPLEGRLLKIALGLREVIAEHRPSSVGVEDIYFSDHPNA